MVGGDYSAGTGTSFSKTLKSTEVMRGGGKPKNESSTHEAERKLEDDLRRMREKYEQTKIQLKRARERIATMIAQQETSEESEGSTSSSKRKSEEIATESDSS